MPQIIVAADRGAAFGEGAVTFRETVNVADFESQHFAMQLVERLGWAVEDADQAERVPASPERVARRRESQPKDDPRWVAEARVAEAPVADARVADARGAPREPREAQREELEVQREELEVQREELEAHREELEAHREELEAHREALEAQREERVIVQSPA
jgi:flagellar motility protein MotE (MotC chaperone)